MMDVFQTFWTIYETCFGECVIMDIVYDPNYLKKLAHCNVQPVSLAPSIGGVLMGKYMNLSDV